MNLFYQNIIFFYGCTCIHELMSHSETLINSNPLQLDQGVFNSNKVAGITMGTYATTQEMLI